MIQPATMRPYPTLAGPGLLQDSLHQPPDCSASSPIPSSPGAPGVTSHAGVPVSGSIVWKLRLIRLPKACWFPGEGSAAGRGPLGRGARILSTEWVDGRQPPGGGSSRHRRLRERVLLMAKDHVLITYLDHSTQCQVEGKAPHSWDSLLSPEWGAEGRPGTLHLFLGTTMMVTLPLLSPAWSMTFCFPTTGPPSLWGHGASCWLGFSSAHPQSLGNAGQGEKPPGAGTNALSYRG